MKRMHRLIVTSATYRQSSRVTPELLEQGPENRLLARGPRVRLEAEVIRDDVLRASGLLSEQDRRPERLSAAAAGVTTEGTYGAMTGRPARATTAIAAACTRSPSGRAPFATYAHSTPPAARSASPAARFPTRRCRP